VKKFLFFICIICKFLLVSQTFSDLEKFNIEKSMDFYNIPGVSIALIENSQLLKAESYGDATEESQFMVSGFNNLISAVAIMILKEAGFVDLDTDVNTYLKTWKLRENIVTRNRKVTLRMILSHMSGIDESIPDLYSNPEDKPEINKLLDRLNIRYYPGLKRRYVWSSFLILEKIIEDLTGKKYYEYITDSILKPLAMNSSVYKEPERPAKGYDLFGKELAPDIPIYPVVSALGLWSTPSDIAKLIIEIDKILISEYEGVISKDSVKEILSYQPGGWGLGVSLKFNDDKLIYRHSGISRGYVNYFISRPYKQQGIIIMTNGENAWKLIMELLHTFKNYKDWGI